MGIPGNEEADEEAKKAAEGKTSDEQQLPKLLRKTLKCSKLAAIQEEGAARMVSQTYLRGRSSACDSVETQQYKS